MNDRIPISTLHAEDSGTVNKPVNFNGEFEERTS